MLRLVPVMQHAVQHIKTPATALSSVLGSGPCRTAASCVQAGPAYAVTAATWQGISNRFPVGFVPAAAYSSGAGSSDAIPPSNLPSGVLSSEASAADDDTIDRMPDSSFPAGAKRTPGPDETMATTSAGAARNDPDVAPNYPHEDPAREAGSAAADPYGPNDASTVVSRPEEPKQESLYPPSGQPGKAPEMQDPPSGRPSSGPDEGTPHPPLERNDPGGSHMS